MLRISHQQGIQKDNLLWHFGWLHPSNNERLYQCCSRLSTCPYLNHSQQSRTRLEEADSSTQTKKNELGHRCTKCTMRSLLNQTSPLKAALEAISCVWFETIAIVPFTYFRTGNVSANASLITIVMKIAIYIEVNRALRSFMLQVEL